MAKRKKLKIVGIDEENQKGDTVAKHSKHTKIVGGHHRGKKGRGKKRRGGKRGRGKR
jgi:hypothetical protein